jgi:hypothetical protein
MKTRNLIFVSLVLVALGLAACGPATPAPSAITCAGPFEATVHQGANAGLSLVGELTLEVQPSGSASGVLTLDDGS